MKFQVSAVALAIGLATVGTVAAAQTQGGDGRPAPRQVGMIKAMDSDGDGKVSKAEFMAFQPKGRHALAPDASISREDFMKRGPQRDGWRQEGKRDGAKDGARDGDRAERRQEQRAAMFRAIDKDSNGTISREEFMEFPGLGMGMGRHGHHRVSAERAEARRAKIFETLDKDGNGVIDPAERAAQREAVFGRLDRNGDGFVTADELPRRGPGRGR